MVKIWQVVGIENPAIIKQYAGHKNEKYCVPNQYVENKYIISGSEDNKIYIWSMQHMKVLQILEGHTGPVFGINVAPNSSKFASCSLDGTIRFWETEN